MVNRISTKTLKLLGNTHIAEELNRITITPISSDPNDWKVGTRHNINVNVIHGTRISRLTEWKEQVYHKCYTVYINAKR